MQGPAASLFAEDFAHLASGCIRGHFANIQGVQGGRFGVTQGSVGMRRAGMEQGMVPAAAGCSKWI